MRRSCTAQQKEGTERQFDPRSKGTIAMNRFFSIAAATALLSLPTIASAEKSAPITITHDGHSYSYTVEYKGDSRIIRGAEVASGEPFTLYVGKVWVGGTVNGQAVSFPLSSVKPLKGVVTVETLASR
jgi:hypothetical protein